MNKSISSNSSFPCNVILGIDFLATFMPGKTRHSLDITSSVAQVNRKVGIDRPYTGVRRLTEGGCWLGKIERKIILDHLTSFYIPCLLVLGVALSLVKSLGRIRGP